MNTKFSASILASVACAAALTLGASGAAQAQQDNVFWSIGMSSPGVQIGVSNAPTVYVQPPIYVQAPVYVQPRPVYVAPRPVYYVPRQQVYYGYPGYSGWGHRQNFQHHGFRGDERRYGYRGDEHRGEGRVEQARGGRNMVGAQSHIGGHVAADMGRRR